LSDVSGTRDEGLLSLEVLSRGSLDHLLEVVDSSVTSSFRSNLGSTEVESLTGKDTSELVSHLLVGTEEETDFSSSNSDISSGNIGIGTNVSGEFPHEGEAETTDLVVGLTLGVEIGSSLSSSHVETSESVLEDLFESQELEDGKVDGRVKTKSSLVRTENGGELNTETGVDLASTLVIFPCDTESDDSLRDHENFESILVFRRLLEERSESRLDLVNGLLELGLGDSGSSVRHD